MSFTPRLSDYVKVTRRDSPVSGGPVTLETSAPLSELKVLMEAGAASFASISGSPTDNPSLSTALDLKAALTQVVLNSEAQSLTTEEQAQARSNIGAVRDSLPISTTSPLRTQTRPHAIIYYEGYVYIWDRQGTIGCKINPLDFNDITYFTTNALTAVCDGGDGYIYGISEQGTCPIVQYNPADGTTATVVAAPAIVLGAGPSICTDGAGNLYITSAYDVNNTRVLKYVIGTWGAAAATKNIAKKKGHAIIYAGGSIWLTGYNTNTTNGWYAKLDTALADIIAATDFAPGGGEVLTPTDDIAFDGTYLYIVSEFAPLVANAQMAKVTASSGAITYHSLPNGADGAAYTALWDGATSIIIPQYERHGVVAIFNTVGNTFSERQVSLHGPVNEIVFAGEALICTTYNSSGGAVPAGGLIGKLIFSSQWNYGPFFDYSGNVTLPENATIIVGDGTTGSLSIGVISAQTASSANAEFQNFAVSASVTQNTGLAHKRITTGSINGGASALVTVTFDIPLADTNYTAVATVSGSNVAATGLTVVKEESRTTDDITYRVLNNSGGALTGTLQVIAMHD